jgi:AcrR family transcriptional regulator
VPKNGSGAPHPYHHGNLRRSLLDEALRVIEEEGPSAVSLRDLARRLGVSHAAPTHHFADKTALFTAIALEGYEQLGAALREPAEDFLDVGLAYVRYSSGHPGHIRVMFQPSLYQVADPEIEEARRRCHEALFTAAARFYPNDDPQRIGLAGWSLMHGIATLWLGRNLDEFGDDPVELARWIAQGALARRAGAAG